MEADKPGWNDALNGLPGLFGSSLCETIELLRLAHFYKENIQQDIEVLVEQKILFNEAKPFFDKRSENKIKPHLFWDQTNLLKESFRSSTIDCVSGKMSILNADEIMSFLNALEKILDDSICGEKSRFDVIPTYYINKVNKYHLDGETVIVDEFKTTALDEFLEASTHLGKLGPEYFTNTDYESIKKSDIFDAKLHLYKTCGSIEKEPMELGRIRSFSPGWLERECAFLHMSYKYLVALFKAEKYDLFFEESNSLLTYKLNPEIYGRNPLEASSFIVPSCNLDQSKHGQGFFARLTGANAEVIDLFYKMFLGEHLFEMIEGQLTLSIQPRIPTPFFDEEGMCSIKILNNCTIYYVNKNKLEYNEITQISYLIDGKKFLHLPSKLANDFREGILKEITVVLD